MKIKLIVGAVIASLFIGCGGSGSGGSGSGAPSQQVNIKGMYYYADPDPSFNRIVVMDPKTMTQVGSIQLREEIQIQQIGLEILI